MSQKKVTAKNFNKVVENFKEFYHDQIERSGKEETKSFLGEFNEFLNKLRDDDVFGTEGQCDPRGDNRD